MVKCRGNQTPSVIQQWASARHDPQKTCCYWAPWLRRENFNFHRSETDASHRLLNAIEPGSYIRPHRHLDPAKDETLVVVSGRLGAVVFDEVGSVVDTAVLAAGGERCGINLLYGTYHTVLALEQKTVFFESKAGPYRPLDVAEMAPWAPAEGAREAEPYLAALRELFE